MAASLRILLLVLAQVVALLIIGAAGNPAVSSRRRFVASLYTESIAADA
jgi:hypothetical protein